MSAKLIDRIFYTKFTRKGFLKFLGVLFGMILFSKNKTTTIYSATKILEPRPRKVIKTEYDMVVAKGKDPSAITRKAIETLGGINRFVKKGDIVVIKPNIAWDRNPELAATTNPEIVATLVKMCISAGAKKVNVFDRTCHNERHCYKNSGIYDAVKNAGGSIYFVSDWKFIRAKFPENSLMFDWPIYLDAVKCDCFINVPIAKHHELTGFSLSMKNLMGVCGANRGKMHSGIDINLVDLTEFIKPDLTIIDAYRILVRNGPTGGNLSDVELKETVIASTDPVLSDAYAVTLFGHKPQEYRWIELGAESKLGRMDIKKANIKLLEI